MREKWRREPDVPLLSSPERHRVVPGSTEGMATSKAAKAKPGADEDSMPFDGLGGVVRARRQKPAGASKIR